MPAKNIIELLLRKFRIVLFIYFIILIAIVLFAGITLRSDALYFFELAERAVADSVLYPSYMNLYDPYIASITYVNILAALLSIIHSPQIIGFYNIVIAALSICFLFLIIDRISGKKAAKIGVIIFLLYPSTMGLVRTNLTELTFCFLMLAGIWFYLRGSSSDNFLSGFIFAVSATVRPVGVILVLAFAASILIKAYKKKEKLLMGFYLVLAFSGTLIIYSLIFYHSTGLKVLFPSTSGLNLLIGANDYASGGYDNKIFLPGYKAHISEDEKVTFYERNARYTEMAVTWIKANPVKWISLMPAKIWHLIRSDIYAVERLTGINMGLKSAVKTISSSTEQIESLSQIPSTGILILFFILLIVNHIYYFGYIVLFFAALFRRKDIMNNVLLLEILLFFAGAVLLSMVTFGSERFKYPLMISGIILLAPIIESWLRSEKNKHEMPG